MAELPQHYTAMSDAGMRALWDAFPKGGEQYHMSLNYLDFFAFTELLQVIAQEDPIDDDLQTWAQEFLLSIAESLEVRWV